MSRGPPPSSSRSSVPIMPSTATCTVPTTTTHIAPRVPRFLNWVKEDGVDLSVSAVEIGKLIAEAASSSPYVGMAVGILANILKLISKDRENREVEMSIVERCAWFISALSTHVDAQNITQLACFQQFQADLEKIQHLIETKTSKRCFRFKRFILADNYATQLQRLQLKVEDTLQLFHTSTIMRIDNKLQGLTLDQQHQNTSCDAPIPDAREEHIPVIEFDTIHLIEEINVARGSRVYSARLLSGNLVVVKVFEWKKGKENFNAIVKSHRNMRHPNILQFRARSPINEPEPFIVFYAMDTKGSAVEHIVKVIPSGVSKTYEAGTKLIADLAAALDYLCDHNISLPPISSESYFIFMDGDKAMLSFDMYEILDSESASPITSSNKGLSTLRELCSQTFNSANEILYRDYSALDNNIMEPEPSGVTAGTQVVRTDGDHTHANLRNSGKMPHARPKRPRREIKWKMILLSEGTITLKHLLQKYRNALISSTPLNYATRSTNDHRVLHRCRGYWREEVTFTAIVMNCKVITSRTPFLHELCSVCGGRVEKGRFDCISGQPNDGVTPTFRCTKCSIWEHSNCKSMGNICSGCDSSNVHECTQDGECPGENSRAEIGLISKRTQELQNLEMELARRYGMDGFAEIESVAVLQEARMRALSKDPRVIQAMNCTRFVINALRILGGLKRFILR